MHIAGHVIGKAVLHVQVRINGIKSVLALALPAVGEQLLNMMVGIVNTFLVGHLGAAFLAGVGLASQVNMLATSFFSAVATGTTALVARHTGAREPDLANRIMHQSFLLGGATSVTMSVLCFVGARAAMELLGAQGEVVDLGSTYMRIVVPTFLASALMFIGNAALRGSGDTRTPMQVMAIVNVVNIVVSYTLVNGLGPFPALGVAGPAIGAALGQIIGCLIILAILAQGRSELRLHLPHLHFDGTQIRRIINVGVPAGMEFLSMRLGMTVFAGVVASLGTVAYAAHQVVMTSESLSFMPGFGFGVAAATLVGQGLGARDPALAERNGSSAWRLAVLFMSVMGIFFLTLPQYFMAFFTSEADVIAQGIPPLRLIAIAQPLLATTMVLSGALRGAGDTRGPFLVTTLGIWLVRLPLGLLLVKTTSLGLTAAWITMIIDQGVRSVFYIARFRAGRWKSTRV